MRGILSLPYPQEPYIDPEYLLNGGAIVRSNMRRDEATADLTALTTAVCLSVALPLQKRDIVRSLMFRSGGTAANTPTNWWFALYDPAGAFLRQTADQTNTAWAADDHKRLDLTSLYEAPAAGVYYATIMMKATTPVSLAGKAVDHAEISAGLFTGQKPLARTHGSALTDTAPATIATPTDVVNVPLVYAFADAA